jgi:hypothetical protein|tara:strand:- start:76 stop:1122 length:1047 start_codon:yes stop_codon:yes gene_type:complete
MSNNNQRISPRQWLKNNLYEKSNFKKPDKRNKISNDNFIIPEVKDWQLMTEINYNCSQLKKIAKYYKQKVSGNKNELVFRIANFLKFSQHAIVIQKHWRGNIRRQYNVLKGTACFNRRCTNETDFLSFTKLQNIEYSQFFSYKDDDDFVYGFDVKSIYNLFKQQGELKNPYNRKPFPKNIVDNITKIIRLSPLLKEQVQIKLVDDTTHLSKKKIMELKAISLFHKIDTFGHITDIAWFTSLDKIRSIKYIKELYDIWNYRAQLSNHIKFSICPPNGNPFQNISIQNLHIKSEPSLKKTILRIIENMISKSQNTEHQSLGAFYVLGAFTLVNNFAAQSLPWLYQSVHYS